MDTELYLYESHLSGWYFTDEYLKNTYCETCGDSDNLIGGIEIDNTDDLFELILEVILENPLIDMQKTLKELKEDYCRFGSSKAFEEAVERLIEFAKELLAGLTKCKN